MQKLVRFSIQVLFLLFTHIASSQILFDFEDGEVDLWGIEGDGNITLEVGTGNPGNALRVDEPATGAINYVIANPLVNGIWSAVTATDSIVFDLFAGTIATVGFTTPYMIELRGDGGTVNILPDWTPVYDQWQHVAVPMDPTAWNVVSGTWAGTLASIDMVRIRAEFIDGDEFVLLDNVGLTFTPVVETPSAVVCSTFEPEDGLDGWNFQNTESITASTDEGNPPNSIRIADMADQLGLGYAPPRFRGDLGGWVAQGALSFDLRVNTALTSIAVPPHLARLAGPGGEATVPITSGQVQAATNAWYSFSFPLDGSGWTITAGDWNNLMANVTTIEVTVEFYNGTAETVFLDNFCMGDLTTGMEAPTSPEVQLFHPVPTSGQLFLSAQATAGGAIVLRDLNGRVVMRPTLSHGMIDIGRLQDGVYFVHMQNAERSTVQRILLAR